MMGFAGLLLTSATGAKVQWTPSARDSRAVTSPAKRAASVERVAPIAIAYGSGTTPLELRRRLAAKAFARTATYDAAIAGWFTKETATAFPSRISFAGRLGQTLRYGENPHQQAALYLTGERRPGVATARQLQGKELSYNNINDTDAAYELVAEFDPKRTAAVAIIKHANPCGVAEGATLAAAYRQALRTDPVSASISPDRIFRKVDLPAPFGPVMP